MQHGLNKMGLCPGAALWPLLTGLSCLLTLALLLTCGGGEARPANLRPAPVQAPASTTAWSFAVMADSQWLAPDDGHNPDEVSIGIINQLNAEFIRHQVKFVIEAGDLTNTGSKHSLDLRATFSQALYNAGIGFFPLRGNHESTAAAAAEFLRVFPQTQTGRHNATPEDAFLAMDEGELRPGPRIGTPFQMGGGFSSPSATLRGLSYAFDHANARFVLLDQFTPADGSRNRIAAQQGWISATLASRPAGTHAFVLGHKNLISPYQPDSLFGQFPADALDTTFAAQDAFVRSLADHGVRYYIHGHDHFHERVRVSASDGSGRAVTAIFSAASSSTAKVPRAARRWWDPAQVPGYGRSIASQEVNTVGYYIYTVDGPRVTVDYHAATLDSDFDPEGDFGSGEFTISTTPSLAFSLRESFGYGLDGRTFQIPRGASYAAITDAFGGTTARVLGGLNEDRALDYSGATLTKAVDTGWQEGSAGLYSPIFSLWGMGPLGSGQTPDTYVLSLSCDPKRVGLFLLEQGWVGITSPRGGLWANAVDLNQGGARAFVLGPWQEAYGLGTHGFDPATNTVWAVLNHAGTFAVAPLP